MFQTPVDIANRACQMMGVQRIADFTENSLQAGELSFVYDKVRRAELRRNVWQFATRRAALRPIQSNTMFLTPAMWSSTTTYGYGAIVSDQSNVLWQSRAQDNLGNLPGTAVQWELYCGPLSVSPYDTTGATNYFSGELVYETPYDGTYSVYLSLTSNNSQDPRAPSLWINSAEATQPLPGPITPVPSWPQTPTGVYSEDQVVIYYAAWASGTTYAAGNTVAFNGSTYVSLVGGNVGHEPDLSPAQWALVNPYLAPQYYNALTAYSVGTFVTYLGVNYVCIMTATGQTPSTSPTYWVAQAAGTFYASVIDFNQNNDPSQAPAAWSSATTYSIGQSVYSPATGYIYTSIGNGNVGNDPSATTGYWTNTNVLCPWTSVDNFGTANDSWLQLPVALSDLQVVYPIGSGPSDQDAPRNVYMLPANFLRRAPQDPKAGSTSFLGAPSGLMDDDWNLEGRFIVTREVLPIVLRFVADVTDVTSFDDMFCEGLANRIAFETAERLTQSTQKKAQIAAAYRQLMSEARIVNGIETGATEPFEDDYITCRV